MSPTQEKNQRNRHFMVNMTIDVIQPQKQIWEFVLLWGGLFCCGFDNYTFLYLFKVKSEKYQLNIPQAAMVSVLDLEAPLWKIIHFVKQ
jgi:hypothetical protein